MRSQSPTVPVCLWLATMLILIGAAPRITLLTANRFHPDEALFATLARLIVSGRDPFLSSTTLLVDKPPLFYYILAGGISLFGGTEFAARLPGLFAGLITPALIARLSWQLWRSGSAALLALALCAFSPFSILFAPTVFADPQYVMWLLASMVALNAGRWGWGGLLLGLAVATKQNALFFAPLALLLGIVQNVDANTCRRSLWRWAWRFMLAFGCVLVLVFAWDFFRSGAASFWATGAQINNPGRLARSREVLPRALEWLDWLHYLTALGWLNWLVAALLIGLVPLEMVSSPRTRGAAGSLLLLACVIGYLGLQWLVAFPVLDRYLLPIVLLIALLSGRAVILVGSIIWSRPSNMAEGTASLLSIPWLRWLVPLILAAVLARPACLAAQSAYPIGGDHGAYDGIDQAAAYLRQQPLGSVVYYHALGWMLDYYLFDSYLYLTWFGSPAWLCEDLSVFGRDDIPRYLVLSKLESSVEILDAVHNAGCDAVPVLDVPDRFGSLSVAVYRLVCSPQ
ncbi:MAG: glycosyltransferase family 39 protein [Anaerolineae bacterium]|nr:glycosyltransferase family 39 protein [Anaerolineae bacterium]